MKEHNLPFNLVSSIGPFLHLFPFPVPLCTSAFANFKSMQFQIESGFGKLIKSSNPFHLAKMS